jgi:hypothetical protein
MTTDYCLSGITEGMVLHLSVFHKELFMCQTEETVNTAHIIFTGFICILNELDNSLSSGYTIPSLDIHWVISGVFPQDPIITSTSRDIYDHEVV